MDSSNHPPSSLTSGSFLVTNREWRGILRKAEDGISKADRSIMQGRTTKSRTERDLYDMVASWLAEEILTANR